MRPRRSFLIGVTLLLLAIPCDAVTTVATVGDSFADGIYLAMFQRQDLQKVNGIKPIRWSRPIIGLARNDYFDYASWLHATGDLGKVDFCVVQVGSNDAQPIPVSKGKWIAYRSDRWQEAYKDRVRNMLAVLKQERCRNVIWILQPGFEKRSFMARECSLISSLQAEALAGTGVQILDLATNEDSYSHDNTHFNRPFTLSLGTAVFQAIVWSRESSQTGCYVCHRAGSIDRALKPINLLPLRIRLASN